MPDSSLTFRPITDADLPFLKLLYASTRQAEMESVPWSKQEKEQFLESQFDAQHQFYQQQFTDASFDLIALDEQPIGRLYLDQREDEIRIIDIALIPEQRGKGIGGQLLRDVLDQATNAGKMVRIHVEKNNPAMNLYQRLGFSKQEDQGVYDLMEWQAY